jgi:hypothetical protein
LGAFQIFVLFILNMVGGGTNHGDHPGWCPYYCCWEEILSQVNELLRLKEVKFKPARIKRFKR